jgi:serine/threonine protein kinase
MSNRDSLTGDVDLTQASSFTPFQRNIGSYHLLQKIGDGGMGEVWLAEQTRPVRRQVALKLVKAGMDTAQVLARFDAERQALALMDHAAIAKIFDGGSTPEGRPYFAMEYVRGDAITQYCDRNRLSVRDRLELFIQLCDGVQHAHQKGIIHRDLKPSNVLVSLADGKPVPHIIDFGIAKAMAQPLTEQPLFTAIGGFVGTVEYMSPEQAELSVDIDTRTDVYSLGVLLYELLTGTLPFERKQLRNAGVDEIRRTIREQDPPKPSTRVGTDATSTTTGEQRRLQPAKLVSLLRGDLDWITMRALEKERGQRYQTANELALDVRRYLNYEPVMAGPPSTAYRVRKFARRHRLAVAAATSAVIVLAVFAVVTAIQAGRIARERDRANNEAATSRQISEFLTGLFTVSDPSEARGRAITAREILDKGARDLEQLKDQPELQARLQATIGSVYTSLGVYPEATPLLEQSVATRRRILGADHPDTLKAVNEWRTCIGSKIATPTPSRSFWMSSSDALACLARNTKTRSRRPSTSPVSWASRSDGRRPKNCNGRRWPFSDADWEAITPIRWRRSTIWLPTCTANSGTPNPRRSATSWWPPGGACSAPTIRRRCSRWATSPSRTNCKATLAAPSGYIST